MGLQGKAVNLKTIIRSRRKEEKEKEELFRLGVDAARRRAFLRERGETLRHLSPEECESFRDTEVKAGESAGHTLTIMGVTMDDTPECSCGWKGPCFWDGKDFAYDEWLWHLLETGVVLRYPTVADKAA